MKKLIASFQISITEEACKKHGEDGETLDTVKATFEEMVRDIESEKDTNPLAAGFVVKSSCEIVEVPDDQ